MQWMPALLMIGSVWIFFYAIYINDVYKRIREDIFRIKGEMRKNRKEIEEEIRNIYIKFDRMYKKERRTWNSLCLESTNEHLSAMFLIAIFNSSL